MKKLLTMFVVFAAVVAFAPAALAQDGDEPTTYSFEDDLVTGDLMRPDGENLVSRRRGRHASLIQVRRHFVPEMLKSVENL